MSRDYKSSASHTRKRQRRRTPPKKQRGPVPGWVIFLLGVTVGLLGIYFDEAKQLGTELLAKIPSASNTDKPVKQKQEKKQKEDDKPRVKFDFYTVLPEMEIVVPENDPPSGDTRTIERIAQPGTYILQAGSFRKLEQADQLKAQLTLLGMNISIQTVTINNKDTWHRVRVGPFSDLEQLNNARVRLKEHNIKTILLKLKG